MRGMGESKEGAGCKWGGEEAVRVPGRTDVKSCGIAKAAEFALERRSYCANGQRTGQRGREERDRVCAQVSRIPLNREMRSASRA
jgi:hypothetical protein